MGNLAYLMPKLELPFVSLLDSVPARAIQCNQPSTQLTRVKRLSNLSQTTYSVISYFAPIIIQLFI